LNRPMANASVAILAAARPCFAVMPARPAPGRMPDTGIDGFRHPANAAAYGFSGKARLYPCLQLQGEK
jgi:hypothetical protein